MPSFAGFPSGRVHQTPIPAPFFTELLAQIDHLGELKVTLYAFWFLDRQEGPLRYITLKDFLKDRTLLEGITPPPGEDELGASERIRQTLQDALERATRRGSLLRAVPPGRAAEDTVFFLNTPRGRSALQSLGRGEWMPGLEGHVPAALDVEHPNIYKLYESNIGPLTPLISDALREAEQTYPPDWIEEVFRKAVAANARSWRYIEKILRSWKEKGRDDRHQRDAEKDSRRYIEGELGQFVEH
jgi:DnaD/phage-associated family protein